MQEKKISVIECHGWGMLMNPNVAIWQQST